MQALAIFKYDNDKATKVSRVLMALYASADEEIVLRPINDWFSQKEKNFDRWIEQYGLKPQKYEHDKLNKQVDWCKQTGVESTPTIVLNEYKLP